MILEYNLTQAEYHEACRMTARAGRGAGRSRAGEIVSLAGAAIGIALLLGMPSVPRSIAAALLTFVSLFHLIYQRHQLYALYDRGWKDWQEAAREAALELTGSHLILTIGDCVHRYTWKSFVRTVETNHLFIFFGPAQSRVIIVAKRLLTHEQLEELRQIAEREVPEAPGRALGFPVLPAARDKDDTRH